MSIFPIPTGLTAEPGTGSGAVRDGASASHELAWKAACRQALGGSFDGWFQPPPDGGAQSELASTAARGRAVGQSGSFGLSTSAHTAHAGDHAHTAAATLARWTAHAGDPARTAASQAPDAAVGARAEPALNLSAAMAPDARTSAVAAFVSAWMAGPVVVEASADATVLPVEPPLALAQDRQGDARSSSAPAQASADEPAAQSGSPSEAPDARRSGGAAQEREPMRLHAEWTPAGVRLWLGIDAAGLPLVRQLAREVHDRLRAQGTRVLGVVCNGREVSLGATAAPELTDGLAALSDARPAASPSPLPASNRDTP